MYEHLKFIYNKLTLTTSDIASIIDFTRTALHDWGQSTQSSQV